MENGTRAERDRKWTHRITKHGIAWNIYDLLHSTQMLVSLDHPLFPCLLYFFFFLVDFKTSRQIKDLSDLFLWRYKRHCSGHSLRWCFEHIGFKIACHSMWKNKGWMYRLLNAWYQITHLIYSNCYTWYRKGTFFNDLNEILMTIGEVKLSKFDLKLVFQIIIIVILILNEFPIKW